MSPVPPEARTHQRAPQRPSGHNHGQPGTSELYNVWQVCNTVHRAPATGTRVTISLRPDMYAQLPADLLTPSGMSLRVATGMSSVGVGGFGGPTWSTQRSPWDADEVHKARRISTPSVHE